MERFFEGFRLHPVAIDINRKADIVKGTKDIVLQCRALNTPQHIRNRIMKLTDLEKAKGLKINSKMSQTKTPGRFAAQAHVAVDRREQRKRDQAAGLVPFAVKLDAELVKHIQQLAGERDGNINEVVAELLDKALGR